jgi:DHA1 family tetracycline resistance protein-like MFS transporter
MQRNRLLTIFIIVFVDLLGFGLILPLLPYYAESFGATPAVVGLLVASYAAAQFIGAPVLGRLSDRYGRRPILLLSIGGTLLGFLLLGLAPTLATLLADSIFKSVAAGDPVAAHNLITVGLLFASRLVDGLTGGNISVAQAYITDVTDLSNRSKGLGIIGAAFGLGFIFGPAVGGALSVAGYSVPAFAAAGLSFLNLLAVFFWLPESLGTAQREAIAARRRAPFTLAALWGALNRPRVGPLLNIRLFFGLAFSMFQTIFSLYAQARLGLTAQTTGFVLAYVGLLSVLVQGVGISWLTRRISDSPLILGSVALMAVSLLAWAFTPNLVVLLVVLAPLALAGGTLNTVINSALTKSVYPEEAGGTLGLSASIESLTRVVAPSAGGLLLERLGTWAPGAAGALIMAWVVTFTWRRLILRPDAPLPPRNGDPVPLQGQPSESMTSASAS